MPFRSREVRSCVCKNACGITGAASTLRIVDAVANALPETCNFASACTWFTRACAISAPACAARSIGWCCKANSTASASVSVWGASCAIAPVISRMMIIILNQNLLRMQPPHRQKCERHSFSSIIQDAQIIFAVPFYTKDHILSCQLTIKVIIVTQPLRATSPEEGNNADELHVPACYAQDVNSPPLEGWLEKPDGVVTLQGEGHDDHPVARFYCINPKRQRNKMCISVRAAFRVVKYLPFRLKNALLIYGLPAPVT